jgi:hypothetical protein
MVRVAANQNLPNSQMVSAILSADDSLNANDVDGFVTAEPTPKMESRRGWRRRRIRRGKS